MSCSERRPRFLLDLAEELAWLNTHAGAEVAERWYESLLQTVEFIEKTPQIGRERKDLSPVGIRFWRIREFPRWLVFYAVNAENQVVFYRIRSGTMNLLVMNMKS